MKRLALVIALLLVVAPGSAEAKRKSCAVRGAAVIGRNGRAEVLRREVPRGYGGATEIWGCLRARKRPVLVQSALANQYTDTTITAVGLHGTFVGTSSTTYPCETAMQVFSLVRRAPQHSWHADSYPGADDCARGIDTFAMGAGGRAIFLEGSDTLHAFDSAGERVLDQGAIDKDSVEVLERIARWTNAGEERSAPLS
jgi:hypothetical protein